MKQYTYILCMEHFYSFSLLLLFSFFSFWLGCGWKREITNSEETHIPVTQKNSGDIWIAQTTTAVWQ